MKQTQLAVAFVLVVGLSIGLGVVFLTGNTWLLPLGTLLGITIGMFVQKQIQG
jgi:hypothetical protein